MCVFYVTTLPGHLLSAWILIVTFFLCTNSFKNIANLSSFCWVLEQLLHLNSSNFVVLALFFKKNFDQQFYWSFFFFLKKEIHWLQDLYLTVVYIFNHESNTKTHSQQTIKINNTLRLQKIRSIFIGKTKVFQEIFSKTLHKCKKINKKSKSKKDIVITLHVHHVIKIKCIFWNMPRLQDFFTFLCFFFKLFLFDENQTHHHSCYYKQTKKTTPKRSHQPFRAAEGLLTRPCNRCWCD